MIKEITYLEIKIFITNIIIFISMIILRFEFNFFFVFSEIMFPIQLLIKFSYKATFFRVRRSKEDEISAVIRLGKIYYYK